MIKHNFDLFIGSKQLLKNTTLNIAHPGKYGLIGYNGSGKSTLLKSLHENYKDLNVYYVEQDFYDNTDKSILELILQSNKDRSVLLEKIKTLENNMDNLSNEDIEKYNEFNEALSNYSKDEANIKKILSGLGFTKRQQESNLNSFSGGWKMRVSLARALYMKPRYLLLDEPTNHLDLEGTLWFTDYLKKWKNSLVIVSHDRYFLNEVCDNIIHIFEYQLTYYSHGYTKYLKAFEQKLREIEKTYKIQQTKIKEMKKKQYTLEQISKTLSLIELPKKYKVNIFFPDPGSIKSINIVSLESVSFSFDDNKILFNNIDFYVDISTRVALVGKNGVGKTSFMKILAGKLLPTEGNIIRDPRSIIYYYDQHVTNIMNDNLTLVEYLSKIDTSLKNEEIRKILGTVGFDGKQHNNKIATLSTGQRMKLCFIPIIIQKPHLILLDEPTNNLDIESIDSLIECINAYKGGVIVVSHNVDLITRINCNIKLVENESIKDVDFDSYQRSVIVANEI